MKYSIGDDGVLHRDKLTPLSSNDSGGSNMRKILAVIMPFVIYFILGGVDSLFYMPITPAAEATGIVYIFKMLFLAGAGAFYLSYMLKRVTNTSKYVVLGATLVVNVVLFVVLAMLGLCTKTCFIIFSFGWMGSMIHLGWKSSKR